LKIRTAFQRLELSLYSGSTNGCNLSDVNIIMLFLTNKPSDKVYIQCAPGGKVSIQGGHSIGHSKQKNVICTCVLLRRVSEIVDKKEILRTVSDTGIYCSSDKLGTVYIVYTFSKIPPSTSVHFAARVRTTYQHIRHL
jgi:hypothetical protein